jgi:hypothetical protein
MVLVPAKELRYFKLHSSQSDALFSQIMNDDTGAKRDEPAERDPDK